MFKTFEEIRQQNLLDKQEQEQWREKLKISEKELTDLRKSFEEWNKEYSKLPVCRYSKYIEKEHKAGRITDEELAEIQFKRGKYYSGHYSSVTNCKFSMSKPNERILKPDY